jgi:predicted HicB family RNase H-like nuclease
VNNVVFEYNGYSGSVEPSIEDCCLFGKILFINDLVTYEAETIADLQAEFIAAVDDYLLTCKEIGKEPQKPFKGSFNIRISPELHRKAALEAYKENISLNELTAKAIDAYVNKIAQPINIEHHEHHDHHHYHAEERINIVKQTIPDSRGEHQWTISPAIMSKSR